MEPVSARAATRQMMASYRQVRSQLEEVKIKVAHGRHAFGWYSIPRVMEAFLIGGFETLDITGVLPPGAASDPRDPSLSDLRMEYFLAKVESWYQEPPIIASHSSAYVYLFWEIAALGVDPGSIRIESSDEKAGTMALSFDLPGGGGEPRTRTIRYSMADIEGTRKAGLAFPNETDPIVFEAEGDALPSALLFIGESVIKQLPDYQRMSFGNRISLYILENRMQKERVAAPKSRKAEKKKEPPPPPQAREEGAGPGDTPADRQGPDRAGALHGNPEAEFAGMVSGGDREDSHRQEGDREAAAQLQAAAQPASASRGAGLLQPA